MAGDKALAATQGIREMLMECQARGPAGPDRSYFKFLLIRFDDYASIDPQCDLRPVRKIDPDRIEILGDGGQTNITAGLELALERLRPYMDDLHNHAERAEHPLPLVLVFSDGQHNVGNMPNQAAQEIKSLQLDGEPIVIASAGVSIGDDHADDQTLQAVASSGCYVPINSAQSLTAFISSVGSSGASRPADIAKVLKGL